MDDSKQTRPFQILELLIPTLFIAMVSCILIKAEKPLTFFSFFKANFATLFSTARAVLVLLYSPVLDKKRAQILTIWKNVVRRVSHFCQFNNRTATDTTD